jgi:hypothetical protein
MTEGHAGKLQFGFSDLRLQIATLISELRERRYSEA